MARLGGTAPLLLPVLLATGCAHPPQPPPPAPRPDPLQAGLQQAADYLLSKQGADGSWRSEHYNAFQDGRALTPVVLSALLFAARRPGLEAAYDRGVDFVASLVTAEGKVDQGPYGLEYPVYTLSASLLVLNIPRNRRHLPKLEPLLALLRERQLDEARGWSASDLQYGGWGYFHALPDKPAEGAIDELLASNLTSTLFASGALALSGVTLDDPAFQKARLFVERCQNYTDPPAQGDDGGFFFNPTDVVPNKAGRAEDAPPGRFRSYGTATADGVRALLRLGVRRDEPRVRAAAAWLLGHFDPQRVPGDYPVDQEVFRDSAYHYWAWTAAHALLLLGPEALAHPRTQDWPEKLSAELLARQRPDGSFQNSASDLREDDPLVATPLAAAALAICRLARAPSFVTAVPMD